MKIKNIIIFGIWSEVRIIEPLVKEFKNDLEQLGTLGFISTQDRQILGQVFGFFKITIDKVVLDFCGIIK